MASVTKNPLCDFRANGIPTVGVKATATTTAPAAPTVPGGNNNVPYLVVQDITATLSGTAAQSPLQVSLIDGTTGGTNVVWAGFLGIPANGAAALAMSYLNIPCKSGFATLEFATAGGTTSQQSVSLGGYFGGGYGS